jgi:endonuclease/exonuclease/phosphatase family metal-dependent hydrolase
LRHRLTRPWVLVTAVALLGLVPLVSTTVSRQDTADDRASLSATESEEPTLARKPRPTRFDVATFNVLGWRHTARGGRKASWPGGRKRMERTLRLMKRHGVDVIGFQELQPPQLEKFNKETGSRWAVYPGGRFERLAMHNSIAWRTKVWERRRVDYLNIPYLWGVRVKMPVIKLRHRKTGRVVKFANFHNPSDSKGNAQRYRDKARRKQLRLATDPDRRVPLIITGDMNEKHRYFCYLVGRSAMHSANGGRANRKHCVPPRPPVGIDWIFGSRAVTFHSYERVERKRLVGTSDHPFLASRVEIRPRGR